MRSRELRARRRPARGPAAKEVAPEPLGLLGGPEDEGVDGLEADRPEPALAAPPEPAGDLSRRPALRQPVDHEGTQIRVRLQNCPPLPAKAVAAFGMHRAI
jgi:hypothetical protein